MSRIIFITTASILALSAGAVSAEGFSGRVGADYTMSIGDSPDGSVGYSSQSITKLHLSGDYLSASGWYFGTDVMLGNGTYIDGTSSDYFVMGQSFSAHAGRDFNWGTGEVFAGYAIANGNDGRMSQRIYGGIAAGRAISDKLSLNGRLGYMDGDEHVNSANADAIRKAVFASIGVKYALNDNIGLNAGVIGASGLMDQDNELASIWGVNLGVDYVVPNMPRLSVYGNLAYTSYFQGGENDLLNTAEISIGVSYALGDGADPRALIGAEPPLPVWMGLTDGVME